jgi:hypothetical protein
MNHWYFIIGSYGATVLVMIVEVLALRARRRAALEAARATGESPAAGARLGSAGATR